MGRSGQNSRTPIGVLSGMGAGSWAHRLTRDGALAEGQVAGGEGVAFYLKRLMCKCDQFLSVSGAVLNAFCGDFGNSYLNVEIGELLEQI